MDLWKIIVILVLRVSAELFKASVIILDHFSSLILFTLSSVTSEQSKTLIVTR